MGKDFLSTTASYQGMTEAQLRRKLTAYHEAGHAIALIVHAIRFEYVTIEEKENSLGHVHRKSLAPSTPEFRETLIAGELIGVLAGMSSEIVLASELAPATDKHLSEHLEMIVNHGSADQTFFLDALLRHELLTGEKNEEAKYQALFAEWSGKSHQIVLEYQPSISALAEALLSSGKRITFTEAFSIHCKTCLAIDKPFFVPALNDALEGLLDKIESGLS